MDTLRGFTDDRDDGCDEDEADMSVDDNSPMQIGTDERRMHVRAYNHWVSLLAGRPFPSIEDIDPANLADFGPNSVLLDFSGGLEDPRIRFLGRALRDECGLDMGIERISQVPGRSLLSRLTDHYLQIIANRAPIGFEAEFVSTRGHNTLYRGILMPFTSNGEGIDFIYGVINWKEMVDQATQARLDAELAAATTASQPPRPTLAAAAWASGPSAGMAPIADSAPTIADGELPLADALALAQQSAAAVRAADTRSRAALYRALGRAHDFALAAEAEPATLTALFDQAGIKAQARAPMTPLVKLVFGADYDKTRLTEFAAVLTHARRHNVPRGALGDFLDMAEGGIKGLVRAERALRRPPAEDPWGAVRRTLLALPVLARVELAAPSDELVLLVARRDPGTDDVAVIAALDTGDAAARRLLKRAAA